MNFVRKQKFSYSKQIFKNTLNNSLFKPHTNSAVLKKNYGPILCPSPSKFYLENTKRLMSGESDCDKGLDKDFDKSEKPKKKSPDGSGRHCFHKEMEAILIEQALEEYNAAFAYLVIALYFGRTDVALPGCQGFFMNMYEEELGHGNIFVNYVLMRGGHVKLSDVKVPENHEYTIPEAFCTACQMEKHIKERLCAVFDVAEKHKDLQVMDLVSTEFMEEQNRSICEMARLVTRSKMADTSVGEHLFDQFIFKSFVQTEKDNLMIKRHLDLEQSKHDIYK